MANNRASARVGAGSGTWGINPTVRRALARSILELRELVEDDFRKQLIALGVRPGGVVDAPRALEANEQRTRDMAMAVVARDVQAGGGHAEAVEAFVRESAYTFLNRMVGLRCLDERGLLVVDGQSETAVKLDPTRNASSLYWRVRNTLPPTTNPREVWRETLGRAGDAISERIRVLFDPQAEHASLLPLLSTLQHVVAWLNSDDVPEATWGEDELLGWVYQYYQSAEKDAAYARLAKGKKLEGPQELAAATCLYTERYMVDYLLQNTLGALWMEMYPESRLPERWPYYVRSPEDSPRVTREPKPLRSVTLIDPACGSGHFLVRAFDLLVQMYREEGREAESEIPHLILECNLYGIDIDARAVQIAALALYLKACTLAGAEFRPRQLNLLAADAVLPGEEPPAEYLARFKSDPDALSLVKSIWQGLGNVREFGSLLHPERAVDATLERMRKTQPLLMQGDRAAEWKRDLLHGLYEEFERQAHSQDLGQKLFGEEAAKGVTLVEALGSKYDVVVMNPPYAGSKNLNDRLKKFVEREYKEGKRDLYAAFILRCRDFARRDGYIGMVTQQSWLFLRSFAALRKQMLEQTAVTTLAHLGSHAFEEIGGEVVNIALFSLRNSQPPVEHRLAAFRLIGPMSPAAKDQLLREATGVGTKPSEVHPVASATRQLDLLTIPSMPFVYWLTGTYAALLRLPEKVTNKAFVRQGICTTDNDQFVRCFWEVDAEKFGTRWFLFAKGGGFRRWAGFEQFVLDWEENGRRVKQFQEDTPGAIHWSGRMPADSFFFQGGWTFSRVLRGTLAVRELRRDAYFGHTSPTAIPYSADDGPRLGFWLNARTSTYLLRAYSQGLDFREGHVQGLPFPSAPTTDEAKRLISPCQILRRLLLNADPTEWTFTDSPIDSAAETDATLAIASLYLTAEAARESASIRILQLTHDDVSVMDSELGRPAGWERLLSGYDELPTAQIGVAIQVDFAAQNRDHSPGTFQTLGLVRIKANLRALYQAGPGGLFQDSADDQESADGDDETAEAEANGARIPIPTETFLEELSQKLEIHPISVYWLLKELREQEGLVSPPEVKRHLEDYASVTLLRLLGYRWPEQDAHEAEHGPILDSDLVDQDGIIPLVPCGDEPTAAQWMRLRLERQFGEKGADQSELEFRQWVGRSIEDWLKRDFFKRHIQQFKQRPIAWHFVSPEGTFQAFVLYHRLSRETLYKLRTTYAGGLIGRLRGEQDRARNTGDTSKVSDLQIQIEDVEEFRARVEKIERGDELKYRVRCRWKGEEAAGRPGPYAPDIDDGVKVNIRPFQEAGLLAVKEVIKKW